MNQINHKIKLTAFDDLFNTPTEVNTAVPGPGNHIVDMQLTQMHPFKDHPFRVLKDAKMAETVESIKKYGILQPGIIRPDPSGGYEIIVGHRRCMASDMIGLTTMPVIIRDLSDDEATVLMVDSNIQREDLLYSEKANAYRMKMEAQKRLTKTKDSAADAGKRSDQILAEQSCESRNTIQRYIRITYLIPELVDMVDTLKLRFIAGVHLSYLTSEEQIQVFNYMLENDHIPSGIQAESLKEYSKQGILNKAVLELVLMNKEATQPKVTLNNKTLQQYFPPEYGKKEMELVIFSLLDEWLSKNNNVKQKGEA